MSLESSCEVKVSLDNGYKEGVLMNYGPDYSDENFFMKCVYWVRDTYRDFRAGNRTGW